MKLPMKGEQVNPYNSHQKKVSYHATLSSKIQRRCADVTMGADVTGVDGKF